MSCYSSKLLNWFYTLVLYIGMFMSYQGFSQYLTPIDPTGTYELNLQAIEKDGDIYNTLGKIQVKPFTKDSIIINFYVCRGAPSYNTGSFIDTLPYLNQRVEYETTMDSSCTISFTFSDTNVFVKQKSDFTLFCGFGYGVHVDDTFIKTSSKSPILRDYLTDRLIK